MEEKECCPRFEPAPWDGKTLKWEDKQFVKDRVTSALHIPLNFGPVMERNFRLIQEAGAQDKDMLVLSDENSLWGSDVYFAVSRPVPGMQNEKMSGEFYSKVFEGPYGSAGKWVEEITREVKEMGRHVDKIFFWYTTCPKCAKKYGKNYVVILAEV
jgi:hypothetical protein